MSDFGGWVRERRKELLLTQKKLARLLGCAPVTVQKIEEGQRRPSALIAEGLARHLEIEPHDLERFLRLAKTKPPVPRAAPSPSPEALSLSVPLTGLVGRVGEVSALKERLLHPNLRLLTLTGTAGVGKTRLALQLAHEIAAAFADGATFIPLAALDDPKQVLATLARRLGMAQGGGHSVLPRLQRWLRDRQMLLVLDNFEHVLEAAPAIGGLLESCPGLRILTTSRQALRLYGEQEWPVEPLPLPEKGQDSPTALGQNPAIKLFVERVQAVHPGFALSAQTTQMVAEIVTRLGVLPLALELAAGRLRHLSLGELLNQLRSESLAALNAGPRDWPQRHQTLSDAIAWSYERLGERLQQVFRHLGVFVGGFEVDAATEVAGASLDDLGALLDASMVRREEGRYGLLETLRVYALGQLSPEEQGAAREAHQQHYRRQLEASPDMGWIESEIGNLRLALRRVIEGRRAEEAQGMVQAMYGFWEVRGYQREGLGWFEEALALPDEVPPQLRVMVLGNGAGLAWKTAAFATCMGWLEEARNLIRELGLGELEAGLLMIEGRVKIEQGRYAEALEVVQVGLEKGRAMGNPDLIAGSLLHLAHITLATGDLGPSRAYTQEGLVFARQTPASFWLPLLLDSKAQLDVAAQNHSAAHTDLLQALVFAREGGHTLSISRVLFSLAEALALADDAPTEQVLQAARLWGAVEAERETSGLPFSVSDQARIVRNVEAVRAKVGDLEWNLAWASGRSMSLREAVEYAQSLKGKKVRGQGSEDRGQ